MSIVSGVDYFLGFVRAVQAQTKKEPPPQPQAPPPEAPKP
jgi:hypothetical protein